MRYLNNFSTLTLLPQNTSLIFLSPACAHHIPSRTTSVSQTSTMLCVVLLLAIECGTLQDIEYIASKRVAFVSAKNTLSPPFRAPSARKPLHTNTRHSSLSTTNIDESWSPFPISVVLDGGGGRVGKSSTGDWSGWGQSKGHCVCVSP